MAEACCAVPPPPAPGGRAGTLSGLGCGDQALVCGVGGPRPLARRLMEMGLLPGTEVTLVRRAAMGDPLEVRLRDYHLSVRLSEGQAIEVLQLGPGAAQAMQTAPPPPAAIPAPADGSPAARAEAPLVLLAGNPNAGKTTVFNALTGSRARVGNYPGVTVERRAGRLPLPGDGVAELVDLPGTYSLNARSPEEQVAVDALLGAEGRLPDALVVVVDANSLERNLYLALQLRETGLPMVVALNMMDEAEAEGLAIDAQRLGQLLGAEVVPMVAAQGIGLEALAAATARAVGRAACREAVDLELPALTRTALAEVEAGLEADPRATSPALRSVLARWAVLSLGEDELRGVPPELRQVVARVHDEARRQGRDLDQELIEARYRRIEGFTGAACARTRPHAATWTDRIDDVLTHPVLGAVVFLVVMGILFQTLFAWCDPLIGGVEALIAGSQELLRAVLPAGLVTDLLAEGVVAGVGNVLVFAPQIAALLFLIGCLEDSGYLARVAFLIDRIMGGVGLHGRAFVPMLSGFSCAIPAVMATRTIESRLDRLLTMMTLPLMSCSARLPVYVLLAAVVFPTGGVLLGFSAGALALSAMYALSVAATLASAAILRRTVLVGPRPPLVLELPPYRWPLLRNLLTSTWSRLRRFLVDAGTIILALTILMWGLLRFPGDAARPAFYAAQRGAIEARPAGEDRDQALAALAGQQAREQLENSYAGRLGKALEPVFEPLGFDWRVSIGILGAFAAREVFVSTMGVVFGISDADEGSRPLRQALKTATWPDGRPLFTPLMGLSLMIFFVLACQCMSTLAVVRREAGSWGWPALLFGYMSVLAYVTSLVVYQLGRALGF